MYKFLQCEQGDKTDVKIVIERVKNELNKQTEQLVKVIINDINLIKGTNCRVVSYQIHDECLHDDEKLFLKTIKKE